MRRRNKDLEHTRNKTELYNCKIKGTVVIGDGWMQHLETCDLCGRASGDRVQPAHHKLYRECHRFEVQSELTLLLENDPVQ